MLLERFVCGRARSNAYVYAPGPGRGCIVLDPGVGAAPRIVDLVRAEGLEPEAVLLTHGHPDHTWTVRPFVERYEVPVFVAAPDRAWLHDPASGGTLRGIRLGGRLVSRMRRLVPHTLGHLEATHRVAGADVEVLPTPGHTRGSVCLRVGELCFTGDTVFYGGVGATGYPGGSRRALRESIRSELLPLPDELRLLPGHGGETTVGAERRVWEDFTGGG